MSLGILGTRPRMTKSGEGESSLKRKNGLIKKKRKKQKDSQQALALVRRTQEERGGNL